MNCECPNCGSTNTRSYSMVYAGGTSMIHAASLYVGDGIGYVPTNGRSQTLKARKAAPPRQRSCNLIGWFFACAFLAMLMIIFVAVVVTSAHISWKAVLIVAAILWASFSTVLTIRDCQNARKFNTDVWPGLWERWNRSYLCERCGTTFLDLSKGGPEGEFLVPEQSELSAHGNQEDPDAKRDLADRYFYGDGVAKDLPRAVQLYLAAASTGDHDAQEQLRAAYAIAEENELQLLVYGENLDAAMELAHRYHYGNLVEQDRTKPAKLYQKLAAAGIQEADEDLELLYSTATVVDLQRMIKDDDVGATSELANRYLSGLGLPADVSTAAELHLKAIAFGDLTAVQGLVDTADEIYFA